MPSLTAQLYNAPIAIKAPTTLRAVVFNNAGNFVELTPDGHYAPPDAVVPAMPTGFTVTAGPTSAILKWGPPEANYPAYGIQQYDAAGSKIGAIIDTVDRQTLDKTITITGLTANVQTFFTVAAKATDGTYGPETAKLGVTPTAAVDTIAFTTARLDRTDLRIDGTGSQNGVTITLYASNPAAPGSPPPSLGTAPVAVGAWTFRNRNFNAQITQVWAVSSAGGRAGPFTVDVRRTAGALFSFPMIRLRVGRK
ncbi:hypothetical protein HK104_005413 [Borealophlyctis nickersoniae]|nr:hypothetical protein HK104_005413 [Borealophlyctis nickersoniae]